MKHRLKISKDRRGYVLEATQQFPRSLEEVFEFFADAFKLEQITPPWLRFSVLNKKPVEMREGLRIDYALRLHGWPITWQSLISQWEPLMSFVDEQIKGPYKHWHHLHTFRANDQGTEVADIIHYGVPLGGLSHWLVVKKDLTKIFTYRQKMLGQLLS